MNRKELEERLEKNQKHQFFIQMGDHWDREDYRTIARLEQEEREIKELLKKLED